MTSQPSHSSQDTRARAPDDAPILAPFRGLRPTQAAAAGIIAPPYDVITTDEARAHAEGREFCFFKVSRPEITMPPGSDPHSDSARSSPTTVGQRR